MRKLPPYSKAAIAESSAPWAKGSPLFVYSGDRAWDRAKLDIASGVPALVFPENEKATSYRWPVKNRRVWIHDRGTNPETLRQLAKELLRYQAKVVILDYSDRMDIAVYRKEQANNDSV